MVHDLLAYVRCTCRYCRQNIFQNRAPRRALVLRSSVDEELQVQKDTLTTMYEDEIAEMKRVNNEVQEKLKKNHATIKKSYQRQKEE